uniref:Uncharacterized protein n=1 Tax=Anguilla anguilla TaxID=7936 RepID=A0A0E9UGQ3_ANGAN
MHCFNAFHMEGMWQGELPIGLRQCAASHECSVRLGRRLSLHNILGSNLA